MVAEASCWDFPLLAAVRGHCSGRRLGGFGGWIRAVGVLARAFWLGHHRGSSKQQQRQSWQDIPGVVENQTARANRRAGTVAAFGSGLLRPRAFGGNATSPKPGRRSRPRSLIGRAFTFCHYSSRAQIAASISSASTSAMGCLCKICFFAVQTLSWIRPGRRMRPCLPMHTESHRDGNAGRRGAIIQRQSQSN